MPANQTCRTTDNASSSGLRSVDLFPIMSSSYWETFFLIFINMNIEPIFGSVIFPALQALYITARIVPAPAAGAAGAAFSDTGRGGLRSWCSSRPRPQHNNSTHRESDVIILQPTASTQSDTSSCRTRLVAQLVHSFVLSRLDYGNSVLASLPKSAIMPLQRVQNAAARLILDLRMNELHVTLALRQLHWLLVDRRVGFTLCTMINPQYP